MVGASAGTGHMMGMVGGLRFESSGSRGVHLGNSTRALTDFANIGHYDRGGPWRDGTLGVNTSGRTEWVTTGDARDAELDALGRIVAELRELRATTAALAQELAAVLNGTTTGMRRVARART